MSESSIVVPLDGSELSERALPYACAFARATKARLLFATVWEGAPPELMESVPDLADDLRERGQEHYKSYLARLVAKTMTEGLEAEAQVLLGHPAEEILRFVEQRDAGLLVMATHGRSGVGRWWYGSVTSTLVRQAPVSTLIVGPKVLEEDARAPTIRRILVPLDGSELAESALPPALQLARELDADVMLAQALHWATQAPAFGVPEFDTARMDRELTRASEHYLARTRQSLPEHPPVETRVLHGATADALIDLVAAEEIGLVVMASHARGGLSRAALGSVSDRMIQGPAPVLLIRPPAPTEVGPATRTRRCGNCDRMVPTTAIADDDRCLRCGRHLHICANCVYFDGISCLLQRDEVGETYPGRDCQAFQFRETQSSPQDEHQE